MVRKLFLIGLLLCVVAAANATPKVHSWQTSNGAKAKASNGAKKKASKKKTASKAPAARRAKTAGRTTKATGTRRRRASGS